MVFTAHAHGIVAADVRGIDRGRYFLACKTRLRDREGARRDLEQSLKLLKTDHFDLYQLHHLVKPEATK